MKSPHTTCSSPHSAHSSAGKVFGFLSCRGGLGLPTDLAVASCCKFVFLLASWRFSLTRAFCTNPPLFRGHKGSEALSLRVRNRCYFPSRALERIIGDPPVVFGIPSGVCGLVRRVCVVRCAAHLGQLFLFSRQIWNRTGLGLRRLFEPDQLD